MISPELLLQITKDHGVTNGELEVLGAIVISGETISDVATRLKLQPEAVRKRLGEVYRKFGIIGKGPGKLAKLQQLLMNNPVPKNQELLQYARAGSGSKVGARGKFSREQELGAGSDHLGSRSISDLSKGKLINEVINKELLISDLEKYTGCISDWDSAPDIETFYDREQELEQLRSWIMDDRSRLIVLYGMGGIGKTSLAVKAAQQLEKEFEVLIWRSLKHTPTLAELLAGIEDFINPGYGSSLKTTIDESITKLITHLKERRCLLILDDLESILEAEEIAGQYRQEHSQYSELVKRIASETHQSCLVIVSNEKITDVVALESTKVHSLAVEGSTAIAKQILASQGLESSDSWDQVITNYGGHPLGLKIVITMIKDLYDGRVEDFLNGTNATAYFDFHFLMDQQFNRLSLLEKKLMYTLTVLHRPISIAELYEDDWLNLTQSELIEVMSSLQRRAILERNHSNFNLQPMVWRHTVEQIIQEIGSEIINFLKVGEIEVLETLKTYPWQVDGEDSNPLLLLMQRYFKSKPMGKELANIVRVLEENHEAQSGYAIDNLKALIKLL